MAWGVGKLPLRPQGWRKQSPRYGLRKKDRRGKAGLLVEKRGEKCFNPIVEIVFHMILNA